VKRFGVCFSLQFRWVFFQFVDEFGHNSRLGDIDFGDHEVDIAQATIMAELVNKLEKDPTELQ
jgi:hypothetical protein